MYSVIVWMLGNVSFSSGKSISQLFFEKFVGIYQNKAKIARLSLTLPTRLPLFILGMYSG